MVNKLRPVRYHRAASFKLASKYGLSTYSMLYFPIECSRRPQHTIRPLCFPPHFVSASCCFHFFYSSSNSLQANSAWPRPSVSSDQEEDHRGEGVCSSWIQGNSSNACSYERPLTYFMLQHLTVRGNVAAFSPLLHLWQYQLWSHPSAV